MIVRPGVINRHRAPSHIKDRELLGGVSNLGGSGNRAIRKTDLECPLCGSTLYTGDHLGGRILKVTGPTIDGRTPVLITPYPDTHRIYCCGTAEGCGVFFTSPKSMV